MQESVVRFLTIAKERSPYDQTWTKVADTQGDRKKYPVPSTIATRYDIAHKEMVSSLYNTEKTPRTFVVLPHTDKDTKPKEVHISKGCQIYDSQSIQQLYSFFCRRDADRIVVRKKSPALSKTAIDHAQGNWYPQCPWKRAKNLRCST